MMDKREPIIELKNDIEAQLLHAHLEAEKIPHVIVSNHDSAYTGIFQVQFGWGHVEAPAEWADRIREIYNDLIENNASG